MCKLSCDFLIKLLTMKDMFYTKVQQFGFGSIGVNVTTTASNRKAKMGVIMCTWSDHFILT